MYNGYRGAAGDFMLILLSIDARVSKSGSFNHFALIPNPFSLREKGCKSLALRERDLG